MSFSKDKLNILNQIRDLLNSRFSHEAENHNSVLAALNPNNAHLSDEHSTILASIKSLIEATLRHNEQQIINYKLLENDQKVVVDSIKNLSVFSELLQEVNRKNIELAIENNRLKFEISRLRDEQNKDKLQ